MIEWIFPTPVYVHIPKFEEIYLIQNEIKKTLPDILEKDTWEKPEGWEDDIRTNIRHRWNTIKDYKLNNLDAYIKKHAQLYIDQIKPFMNNDVFMSHSWFNITGQGESQEWHAHTDSFISGCYYYQTTGNDGRFMIRNPVQFSQHGLFPAGQTVAEKIYYEPVEGMIILFPGWLDHRVEVNKTDSERISIAFNWLTINEERQGTIER
jgi:uncharacterized protein (TIGR02466 family)